MRPGCWIVLDQILGYIIANTFRMLVWTVLDAHQVGVARESRREE